MDKYRRPQGNQPDIFTDFLLIILSINEQLRQNNENHE
jgi:hypothetical protein